MNDKGKYWDEAWNTVIGCTKCSLGCKNCWAFDLHMQRFRAYCQGKKVPEQYAKTFSEIQLLENRIEMPLHWRNPRTVFVNNMGDTFHPDVPFEFVDKMMIIIANCKQHKYLMLTKRPQKMLDYFKDFPKEIFEAHKTFNKHKFKDNLIDKLQKHRLVFRHFSSFPPENLWLGTTICNQAEKPKRDILVQIPAVHRWLSIEPLLEDLGELNLDGIDHVVIGCESGPNRRPCKIEWIESIVEQCMTAGVRCYVKQVDMDGKVSKNMSEWPQELQVRDEI